MMMVVVGGTEGACFLRLCRLGCCLDWALRFAPAFLAAADCFFGGMMLMLLRRRTNNDDATHW